MGRRAALYARVSTADQSCDRQERDLRAFAERSDLEIVGVFRETELSRWGRSTIDLLHTLRDLEAHRVSLAALNGMTFDLSTSVGRMMATLIAGLAEFERDLLRERVRSGLAAAKARGKVLGRKPGQRPKADRYAARVMTLVDQGLSYRLIARDLGLSKNTVMAIVHRHRAAGVPLLSA
jgi:putative DNA-invertase from lambdoid prophage Rac